MKVSARVCGNKTIGGKTMKFSQKQTFVLVGIALLIIAIIPSVIGLVTLIVDTTPPVFGPTTPYNGATFGVIDKISVHAYDPESGLQNVAYSIDGSIQLPLTYVSTTSGVELWEKSITPLTSGSHTFTYQAINKAGLSTSISGSFTIYTALTGKWYVAGIEITSSSQTIYATSTLIAFRFEKITGIEDSKITCIVVEGGSTILTLSLASAGKWTGTYTFTKGSHSLILQADDGQASVIMSMVSFTLDGGDGGGLYNPMTVFQWTFGIAGLVCIGYGLLPTKKGRWG